MNINWNNIRSVNTSLNDGFEEFVCQLARKENVPNKKRFIRKGKPDAGVECFWILEDDVEWAWQAKYFTASLSTGQWGQLDDSVKTVINKHKNVKKYFIAIPIDPADARRDNQKSLQQKWEDHVVKWEEWAAKESLTIEFIPWWASDLIERLQRPENEGLTHFWFEKEEFTDRWFKEYLDMATLDLREKYSPKLNFELEIEKIFDGLARDEKFIEHFENKLNDLLISLKKVESNVKDEIIGLKRDKLHEKRNSLVAYYNEIIYDDEDCDYASIIKIIEDIKSIIADLEHEIDELNKINENEDYNSAYSYLRDSFYNLNNFEEFINSIMFKLAFKPFLLLDGEAGIGKSHLLAHISNKRMNKGKNTILLLGQYFLSEKDLWTQIFERFKIKYNLEEFLGALESKAQIQGSRIIIVIDAINEGNWQIWKANLLGFIRSLKPYKWLGLVISVRTSYVDEIAPEDNELNDLILRYTHKGFTNVEYEASKVFFENYKIEQPTIPLLDPEFKNPLFLKLLCEGLKRSNYTQIPEGMQGITKIMEFFIESINKKLASKGEFDYPESINVVDKVVKKLVEYKLNNRLFYVPYADAFRIINGLQKEYNISGNFIERLISEGVISKNKFKLDEKSEEGIYIAYERFEDHLIVANLIDTIKEKEKTFFNRFVRFFNSNYTLNCSFKNRGLLHHFIKDRQSIAVNKGIVEALSIQLPEKFGKELYELLPEFNNLAKVEKEDILYEVAESFVSSLLWRKHSTITEKNSDYINNVVLHFSGTYRLFWETMISIAPLPDHLLNADKTHEVLSKDSMADRDAWWTQEIHYGCSEDSPIKRLIEWAWSPEDKTHISDESVRLSSIMIVWFLTSTNRRLRDSATKALICLLKDRINVLIDVLIKFEDINDPFVYERLFAVAYGCALRTRNIESLKELSEYVYKTIFDKDLVYPHVLLRDYARNVIEYTLYLKINLNIDLNKIRPPYRSNFPIIPNDHEINKYKLSYDREDFEDYNISQNLILNSMEVEHTRDGKGALYGDFGRYVFQSNFSHWKEFNPIDLKNVAIKRIFDLGYDVKKHGKFDKKVQNKQYDRHYVATERIGKKYQWITMHELLAQIADNYEMEDYWSQKENEKIDFQGPWVPFVRDIDPTVIMNKKEELKPTFSYFDEYYNNWDVEHKSWLDINDFPDPKGIINIFLDDKEYLVLEGNLDWEEPELLGNEKYSYPQKWLWYQLRSYLVKKENFEAIIQILNDKNFMGRWMPESIGRYELFNREFYWSPAYNYFSNNYNNGSYAQKIENGSDEELGEVIVTTEMNSWSSNYDFNQEPSSLKLCNEIFSHMNLRYGEEEGVLYSSQTDEKICYDLSELYSIGYNLVIKKDNFLEFLNENNYHIFWTILGEKEIRGSYGQDEYKKRPSVSGIYYLNDGNIEGHLNYF